MSVSDPYGRTTYHGRRVDQGTKAALMDVEEDLGYELTIVQGSFNGGDGRVSASAGTHDSGRVIDLASYDWRRKVAALRKVGFAAWYRPAIRGLWGAHIHAVLILGSWDNDRGIAGSAFRQITAYRNGRDGLASNRSDPNARPNPLRVFKYPPKEKPVPKPAPFKNNITESKDFGAVAEHALGQMAAKLEAASPNRDTAKGKAFIAAQAVTIRGARRIVLGVLKILPPA